MAKMSGEEILNLGMKILMVVLYLVGTMLTAFNLLAFKSDKYSLFYKDVNQWWFAVGVSILMTVWIIRNWKKL
ncbi:MAG: hypothetical protein ABFS08_06920 [Pseudomonadota bacterium]